MDSPHAKGNGPRREVNALNSCIDFRLSGDLWLDEWNRDFATTSSEVAVPSLNRER